MNAVIKIIVFMKKLLSAIIFMMIAALSLYAEEPAQEVVEVERKSTEGIYFSPYIGYSFGRGYGVNTGAILGYQFDCGLRFESCGTFRVMGYDKIAQISVFAHYDILRDKVVYGTLGFGAGWAFYGDVVLPTSGYRAGIGWNINDMFALVASYTGDMFFFYGLENPNYSHGFSLALKVTF